MDSIELRAPFFCVDRKYIMYEVYCVYGRIWRFEEIAIDSISRHDKTLDWILSTNFPFNVLTAGWLNSDIWVSILRR